MKTGVQRLILRTLPAGMVLLSIIFSLSACTQAGANSNKQIYSSRAKVREAPAPQTQLFGAGYATKGHTGFLAGCRNSCVEHDPSRQTMAFCEMYCNCTYTGLKMKVPQHDLHRLSKGEKPPSSQAILNIQNQCVRAAADNQAQKSVVSLLIKAG